MSPLTLVSEIHARTSAGESNGKDGRMERGVEGWGKSHVGLLVLRRGSLLSKRLLEAVMQCYLKH